MTRRVAIIGAAHRFPGTTPETFWQDLQAEKDLVTRVAEERWSQEAYQHPERRHPGTSVTFSAGSLGDISGFDAAFFNISPREATHMDPQQRLLLELTWETLENAGIVPASLRGSDCGVFVGIASNDYAYRLADDLGALGPSTATGNATSIASNRLAYVFDLHGPSMSLDTACSSSLVAFHQACQSIRAGETDMALAGGISLHLHPYGFIIFSKASMLSATGRCQVFDADGNNIIPAVDYSCETMLLDFSDFGSFTKPWKILLINSFIVTTFTVAALTDGILTLPGEVYPVFFNDAGLLDESWDTIQWSGGNTLVDFSSATIDNAWTVIYYAPRQLKIAVDGLSEIAISEHSITLCVIDADGYFSLPNIVLYEHKTIIDIAGFGLTGTCVIPTEKGVAV